MVCPEVSEYTPVTGEKKCLHFKTTYVQYLFRYYLLSQICFCCLLHLTKNHGRDFLWGKQLFSLRCGNFNVRLTVLFFHLQNNKQRSCNLYLLLIKCQFWAYCRIQWWAPYCQHTGVKNVPYTRNTCFLGPSIIHMQYKRCRLQVLLVYVCACVSNCEVQYVFSKKCNAMNVNKFIVFVEVTQKLYWSYMRCVCVYVGGGEVEVCKQVCVHTHT